MKMKNNMVITKIENHISAKLDELIALQNEGQDLRQNMADPDTLIDNAFDVEEKQREINVLHEVKDYAIETEATDTKSVFNQVLIAYDKVIKDREEQGFDATKEKLNYNSLKIVAEEIEELPDDSNNNNDRDGNNNNGDERSISMDISSSDDSGE